MSDVLTTEAVLKKKSSIALMTTMQGMGQLELPNDVDGGSPLLLTVQLLVLPG